jgi:hypothetical protein
LGIKKTRNQNWVTQTRKLSQRRRKACDQKYPGRLAPAFRAKQRNPALFQWFKSCISTCSPKICAILVMEPYVHPNTRLKTTAKRKALTNLFSIISPTKTAMLDLIPHFQTSPRLQVLRRGKIHIAPLLPPICTPRPA